MDNGKKKDPTKGSKPTPKQDGAKQVVQLRKNLDKMFGPKKGDGSNRS